MSPRKGPIEGIAVTTAAVFGEVLRHFREAALHTQETLARLIPCDRSTIARIEGGNRVPQDTLVKKLDELLETGGVLMKLWKRIDWYPRVEHPDWFERRAEMDAEALSLHSYQNQVVPGLLQTQDYAHALFAQIASGNEVEERTRARLSRQQRFLSPDGPTLIAVLDESCLRNVVGDAAVMYDQCAHLLSVSERPNIRVQVTPAAQPGLVRPNTSMSLIQLPDGEKWVYSESLDRGHFTNDPAVYTSHAQTYDVLRADALSARESAALISEVMEGYAHHGQARPQLGNVGQEQLQRKQRRRLRRGGPRIHRRRPRT